MTCVSWYAACSRTWPSPQPPSRKLGLTLLHTLSVYAKSTALRDPQVLTCDKCWQIPAAAATPHLDAHFADGAIADNTCR
jgi:hypothetical protein